MIKQVRFTNFKSFSFEHLIELPRFLVLVGNNSAGKSNFCDAFEFTRDILDQNLREALLKERRGGFEKIVRGRKPERAIECHFQLADSEGVELDYKFSVGLSGRKGDPIILSEILEGRLGRRRGPRATYIERDAASSKIYNELSPGADKRENWGVDPNYLQSAQLTDEERFPALRYVRDALRSVLVLRPDASILRERAIVGGELRLGGKGEGLVAILDAAEPPQLQKLADLLADERDDFIKAIRLIPAGPGMKEIGILERNQAEPYGPQQISDGTLRLLTMLAVIVGIVPSVSTLVVEEPENGIHFRRLSRLVELCRQRVKKEADVQIILTTHSIPLLHALQREEVMAIVREEDGTSQILPPPDENKWQRFREEAGYTMGDLYSTGLWPRPTPRRYAPAKPKANG